MQFFAHAGDETDTFTLVVSYICFGFVILFWGTQLTAVLTAAIHLLIQKLCGCELIYLNVLGTLFIKENGKFKRRKAAAIEFSELAYTIPSEKISPRLYLCGYVYILIAFTAIFVALAVLLQKSFWTTGVFIILAVKEIFFLVFLLKHPQSPFKTVKQLKNDEKARKAFYDYFRIYGLLFSGTSFDEMPDEWFEPPSEEEVAEKPLAYFGLLSFCYSRLADEGKFKEARQLTDIGYKNSDKLCDLKNPMLCDYLFFIIMDDCNLDLIAQIYSEDLVKYIKSKSDNLLFARFLYAYELLVNKNTVEAGKKFLEFEKLSNICPFKTIVESERKMIKFISEKNL
ncbi:MAG: hypothetical protein FWD48_01970 [Oscillospiraceae bacterium]|nr:hypothetical protein [Oscillospiraceae bacterium]